MPNITDIAMIASFHKRGWSGRKFDRSLSDEVVSRHNAERDTARVNKLVVPKEFISPIHAKFARVYDMHMKMTTPWDDGGDRCLPNARFFEYGQKFNELQLEAAEYLRSQVPIYRDQILPAQQKRMGSLYNAQDYPHWTEFEGLFGVSVSFLPIPTQHIYVTGASNEELERINAEKDREIERRLQRTTEDLWRRLYEVVNHAFNRLREYKGEKGQKFYDSTILNIRELLDLLPDLNITGNQELEQMVRLTRDSLAAYEPEEIRENKDDREEALRTADELLKGISFYTAYRPQEVA